MHDSPLFYLVLLGQVFLLSYYYPRQIFKRMIHVRENYPPSTHPKLYPNPIEHYIKAQRNYRIMNRALFAAGLAFVVALISIPRSGKWDGAILTWLFLAQLSPVMLLDLRQFKEFKLMRKANVSATRRATLQPRRLLDFVSPAALGLAGAVYLAFCGLVVYVQQFEFDWFGGYSNIFGVTLLNLVLASVVFWHLYGRKLNPHQDEDDRRRQIGIIAKTLLFTSIAATVFIAISIVLSALELRELQPLIQSLYLQLLAMVCLQAYLPMKANFDVYREDPVAA